MALLSVIALGVVTVLPPPEFDRPSEATVLEFPVKETHNLCGGKPSGPRIFACAFPLPNHCLIIVPQVETGIVSKAQQEQLLRHEQGHCNGWGGDHLGARN